MEIKLGEYIRTKNGNIGKVIDITNITGQKRLKYLVKWNKCKAYYITSVRIVKHSKNIIDLIQVGDYVNEYKILEIRQNSESGLRYLMYDYVPIKYYVERTDKIKSIVTKEQYESIKYEVK